MIWYYVPDQTAKRRPSQYNVLMLTRRPESCSILCSKLECDWNSRIQLSKVTPRCRLLTLFSSYHPAACEPRKFTIHLTMVPTVLGSHEPDAFNRKRSHIRDNIGKSWSICVQKKDSKFCLIRSHVCSHKNLIADNPFILTTRWARLSVRMWLPIFLLKLSVLTSHPHSHDWSTHIMDQIPEGHSAVSTGRLRLP